MLSKSRKIAKNKNPRSTWPLGFLTQTKNHKLIFNFLRALNAKYGIEITLNLFLFYLDKQ